VIWSARQGIISFGYVIALISVTAWVALAARPLFTAVTTRHSRHQPPLHEQEPPGWLAPLARAVLVLALFALGLATLLDSGDSSQ
jgi:hypothetical protein